MYIPLFVKIRTMALTHGRLCLTGLRAIIGCCFPECPLQETLYLRQNDTKQAAHNSNRFVDDLLKGLGFQQGKDDAGLYFQIADGSIIMIYINDLLCEQQHGCAITGAPAIRVLARDYAITKTAGTPYLSAGEDICIPCLPTSNHSKRW